MLRDTLSAGIGGPTTTTTTMTPATTTAKSVIICGCPFFYTHPDEEWTVEYIDLVYCHYFRLWYPHHQDPIPPLIFYPLNKLGFPNYGLSKAGQVYNWKTDSIINGSLKKDGVQVTLTDTSSAFVHCLVAQMFLGPPPQPDAVVYHKDGDRRNVSISNIAWTGKNTTPARMAAVGKLTKKTREGTKPKQKKEMSKTEMSKREKYMKGMTKREKDKIENFMKKKEERMKEKAMEEELMGKKATKVKAIKVNDEIWKELKLPGHDIFEVSNKGRIKTQNYFGCGETNSQGFEEVELKFVPQPSHHSDKNIEQETTEQKPAESIWRRVDELVLLAFLGPMGLARGRCVFHLNGDNRNDNISNLVLANCNSSPASLQKAKQAQAFEICKSLAKEHSQGKIGPNDFCAQLRRYIPDLARDTPEERQLAEWFENQTKL